MSGLLPLFLRAVARVAACLASRPAATAAAATVLYHGGALPRNPRLERLVCHELLDGDGGDNYVLHFAVAVMRSLG
ncbi:hypothetical protein E2562_011506 [Oryza meyeriana var. granulata]|uniref:Uncharacterized protein n=1 Tax=Oryza meyeriana var. granulata TaxID=110450 RepID=A0A6G1D0X4_9ORYZ|nr:hypothetical protein E2562_011506 [Oryza meyeriana var. granulata]